MAKHRGSFKLDKFLKALDPQLRVQYFAKYSIVFPSDLNFDDDSLAKFWGAIAEEKRVGIEEELHCINDTADQARDCLEQACREFFIQKQDDETSETTAMRVFLKGEDAFSLAFDAYLYYVLSEKLSHHKFQKVTLNFSDGQIPQFKAAVEAHFKDCGKSGHCDIRHRVDGDKHILLIARGDFMRTHLVFDETKGKPDISSFRPAKEDMIVFNKSNNVLSMSLSGRSDDDKQKYLEMFASAFLGVAQIDDATLNKSLVDIDPIKKRTFNFSGNEQIESVKLTEVNAKVGNGAMRLILKSSDLSSIRGYGIGADGGAEFVSAKLKFFIKRDGKKSKGFVVEIKPPENSKIPQKKEKQIIEAYLKEQGVLLE
ncbi:MAG: hypothetical protein NTU66_06080 [Elusimicrobia bacterium]|nr:hypothetical protein [Elusimicrobiota bacterium]